MGPSAARAVNTFKVHEAKDGEVLTLGSIKLKVHHTPGHTLESSCFQLIDSANKDICLFTGDTVFLGEVGRPDLACSSDITSEDLAGMLYDSIQKVKKLDGSMRLYPGHGSGSACGKSIGAGHFCSVGNQFTNNYGFKFTNKNDFVKEVAHNLPKPPSYFFYDAGLNQKGATPYDLALKKAHVPLTLEEFEKVRTQYKVVDTRVDVGTKGTFISIQVSSKVCCGYLTMVQ
jgi:hydroxyacylglutathione hydrolase